MELHCPPCAALVVLKPSNAIKASIWEYVVSKGARRGFRAPKLTKMEDIVKIPQSVLTLSKNLWKLVDNLTRFM